ncbi:hypothetical protein NEUTE2DRAFT_119374, partial [Neurospora tetrasperma FGSC 2509]
CGVSSTLSVSLGPGHMTIQKLTRQAAIAILPLHLAWHELVPGGEPRSLAT